MTTQEKESIGRKLLLIWMGNIHRFTWMVVMFLPCWFIWSIARSMKMYAQVHKEIYDDTSLPTE